MSLVLRALVIAPVAALVCYTAIKAVLAPLALDDFPESLAIKAELMPIVFPVHMVSGGLALILVPLAIAASTHPRRHRPLARLAALNVVIAGVTALPVALVAPVTAGSALGFAMQGIVWLALLALGINHARRGQTRQHRACMLLMAATMSGAVFFRLWLALWAIHGQPRHFELFYACDAWFAWLLPLTLTGAYLQHTASRRAKP